MIKINKIQTKNVENALKKYEKDVIETMAEVVKTTAQDIERNAKDLASVKRVWDNGDLAQNIKAEEQETPFNYKVTAYMPYSAYHEFGTGGLVDVPNEWSEMARQFIGKGIKQVNIMPRPFMYPAFIFGRMRFNKDIREELKVLSKQFKNG